jgi:hypothetical protein
MKYKIVFDYNNKLGENEDLLLTPAIACVLPGMIPSIKTFYFAIGIKWLGYQVFVGIYEKNLRKENNGI